MKKVLKLVLLLLLIHTFIDVNTFELDDLFNTVTKDSLAYDLLKDRNVIKVNAGDSADVVMNVKNQGDTGMSIKFASQNNAEFVATTADVYAAADSATVLGTDFTGAIKEVDAVAGNVYVYRTRRGTGDWQIGLLKIVAVNKGTVENTSIKFEYKK